MFAVRPYKQKGKVVGIEWREERKLSALELIATTAFINLAIIFIGLLIKERMKK